MTRKAKSLRDLKKYFENDESPRSTLAMKLIAEAEFMESTLKGLKREVKATGWVSEFKQGTQTFDRENQALKSYNTTMKNYQSALKLLNDMLPKEAISNSASEFAL